MVELWGVREDDRNAKLRIYLPHMYIEMKGNSKNSANNLRYTKKRNLVIYIYIAIKF